MLAAWFHTVTSKWEVQWSVPCNVSGSTASFTGFNSSGGELDGAFGILGGGTDRWLIGTVLGESSGPPNTLTINAGTAANVTGGATNAYVSGFPVDNVS